MPVHKRLIDNTTRAELKLICYTILNNRQHACSTGEEFSGGTGIMPVHKRLIDNTARAELKPTKQEL